MKYMLPLLSLMLVTGCGGSADQTVTETSPTALVKTAAATLGASSDELVVYGAAEAAPGAERSVIALREAILVSILAPPGTLVGAGQAIATLRPSPTSALDYAKAGSDAVAANAALARAIRLRADGLVSDADVETARAAAKNANATRASMGLANGGTVLRAPISGTVQVLTAKPGDQIAAGTVIASVAGSGDRRARFGVDPAIAARIHSGQPITIEAVGQGTAISATVVGVDATVDATTRLASVFARVPATIGVGTSLRARVSVGASASGITVPYTALLDDGGHSYVFVIDKGVAKKRDVSPGSSSGESIVILKGLRPGERVVTEGGTALEDGMKVRESRPGSPR